jgi:hypothetical protein
MMCVCAAHFRNSASPSSSVLVCSVSLFCMFVGSDDSVDMNCSNNVCGDMMGNAMEYVDDS